MPWISTFMPRSKSARTVARAGRGSAAKNSAYTSFIPRKSSRSFRYTVVETTCSRLEPAASTTLRKFSSVFRVWSRMSPSTTLPSEEPPLRFRAPFGGVVPEAARFRHHAVARDDDDHRVSRARGPDRAARSGPPEASGDLPVRDRLARRNRPQELEDLSLEGRDLERERNVLQIALSRVDMFEDPGQIWVL